LATLVWVTGRLAGEGRGGLQDKEPARPIL
jgi:hypothetical protein